VEVGVDVSVGVGVWVDKGIQSSIIIASQPRLSITLIKTAGASSNVEDKFILIGNEV
jgi:hypothetical protein